MSRIVALVVALGTLASAAYWCWSINTPVAPITTDHPVEVATVSRNKEAETTEDILRTDPMRFLRMSLERIDTEITGYSLTFEKREASSQGKPARLGSHPCRLSAASAQRPHEMALRKLDGRFGPLCRGPERRQDARHRRPAR